jgi:futalosine hydrolase
VKRILVVTAVDAERAAYERGLSGNRDAARAAVTVLAGGVGSAAAAAATAAALARAPYDIVVSAGIGGAFPGAAAIGDLLVAERIIAADLGADGPEGFRSMQELGFAATVFDTPALNALSGPPDSAFAVVRGDLLTVNTATGTAERTEWLSSRYPGSVGEAMEGYGVAVAAVQAGVPFAEVRAVSNLVGPSDRAAWRIGLALSTLAASAGPIAEGLL